MHALITHSHPSGVHHRSRGKGLLLALGLASLAVAGIVLPFVWDLLGFVNGLPKMEWLQSILAVSPVFSWLMMFAWGLAVPVALIYALYHPQTHPWANAAMVAGAMFIAVTWYVHMPAASQCTAMYPQTGMACSVLQWGFSMSLGVATAAYVFLVFMIALSSLGLLAECVSRNEPPRP
ncbi:hypothetical protein ACF8PL_11215 [Delftia sp. WSY_4]|uniref:hypothetical protein n=1 Tax=Delftia TaxID=80865 RepID=UPI0006424DF1|nr:hypothetical protein [Delftia tsuruhatensis]KLO58849.1 hypothetical protein AA671_14750 [Delftia tsuruhatensis]